MLGMLSLKKNADRWKNTSESPTISCAFETSRSMNLWVRKIGGTWRNPDNAKYIFGIRRRSSASSADRKIFLCTSDDWFHLCIKNEFHIRTTTAGVITAATFQKHDSESQESQVFILLNKPKKLFDHREDSIKHVLVDLHYRMQLANIHPHLFREFLSLGEICVPWTQQKVMRDMQSVCNGHVKLPSQAQLCSTNDEEFRSFVHY